MCVTVCNVTCVLPCERFIDLLLLAQFSDHSATKTVIYKLSVNVCCQLMSAEQLQDEKLSVQKTLLQFESTFGRPVSCLQSSLMSLSKICAVKMTS